MQGVLPCFGSGFTFTGARFLGALEEIQSVTFRSLSQVEQQVSEVKKSEKTRQDPICVSADEKVF